MHPLHCLLLLLVLSLGVGDCGGISICCCCLLCEWCCRFCLFCCLASCCDILNGRLAPLLLLLLLLSGCRLLALLPLLQDHFSHFSSCCFGLSHSCQVMSFSFIFAAGAASFPSSFLFCCCCCCCRCCPVSLSFFCNRSTEAAVGLLPL